MKTQDAGREAVSAKRTALSKVRQALRALPVALCSWRYALCAMPLAWLWFVLINDLRVEWTVNPQYSYGWAVPFLCAFLVWKNAETRKINAETLKTETLKGNSGVSSNFSFSTFQLFSFCALAFLYTPTRLIEEANPGWRLMSWALAIEVVGLTLIFIRFALGDFPLRLVRGDDPSLAGAGEGARRAGEGCGGKNNIVRCRFHLRFQHFSISDFQLLFFQSASSSSRFPGRRAWRHRSFKD